MPLPYLPSKHLICVNVIKSNTKLKDSKASNSCYVIKEELQRCYYTYHCTEMVWLPKYIVKIKNS